MKKLEFIISSETEDALAVIYEHSLDSWGEKRANSYLDEFEKSFDMLCNNPNLGHNHPDISIIYRVFLVGKHWVVYYTDKKQLFIVAIIHSSMQLELRLSELLARL